MDIGLLDCDSHNFPNLPLMKISAWHKKQGDNVEFVIPIKTYDKIYVSKIFGDEYSQLPDFIPQAKEIVYGGTGFAITVENEKEVYAKENDPELPYEIEHIYPDYSLYPELTKNKAIGFLTRGCCNNCDFCLVSKKEGLCSVKVADINEWWAGQKEITLLDANILACKDREALLKQLQQSSAKIDFTQGLDAKFGTKNVAELLKTLNVKTFHFAFDTMANEELVLRGLSNFIEIVKPNPRDVSVYILTNFNTSFQEDYYRVKKIQEIGLQPDIRIYRKNALPKPHILRDMQRWCNNRFLYRSIPCFEEYVPRKDGKTIRQLYGDAFDVRKEEWDIKGYG